MKSCFVADKDFTGPFCISDVTLICNHYPQRPVTGIMGLSPHYMLTIGRWINTALPPWAFIIPHYKAKCRKHKIIKRLIWNMALWSNNDEFQTHEWVSLCSLHTMNTTKLSQHRRWWNTNIRVGYWPVI